MFDGTITTNRKARYEYFVEDTLEAGIELKGAEVKSLRDYQASIAEACLYITLMASSSST